MQPIQPNYSPNVVDQTVDYGGATWKGQPGGSWTMQRINPQATNVSSLPGKQDINPATGLRYDVNPTTGVPDDNYWAQVAEPQLKSSSMGGGAGLGLGGANGQPMFDLVGATNAAYNTPEIQAANKAITDRQLALADAQAKINDNPFYSEATRVGKSQQLTQQANADITVQQNILAGLKADAEIKLNAQKGQYDINNDAYKTALSQFNNLVSQGAFDNASPQDLASTAAQTGIPVSMITSIAAASRKKNNPVNVVSATDNAGNLSLIAVDSNGKVVNQTTIASVGGAKTTGTGSTKTSKTDYSDMLKQDARAGLTLSQVFAVYSGYLSADEIYQLYNSSSKYGPDKGKVENLAKYGVTQPKN